MTKTALHVILERSLCNNEMLLEYSRCFFCEINFALSTNWAEAF
jgi:hypothetical protein